MMIVAELWHFKILWDVFANSYNDLERTQGRSSLFRNIAYYLIFWKIYDDWYCVGRCVFFSNRDAYNDTLYKYTIIIVNSKNNHNVTLTGDVLHWKLHCDVLTWHL